jgi:hypothetical protein
MQYFISSILCLFLFAPSAFAQWKIETKKVTGLPAYYPEAPCPEGQTCDPKYSQGLGFRIIQTNDRYIVASNHDWQGSVAEMKIKIFGEINIFDSHTFESLLPSPMRNANQTKIKKSDDAQEKIIKASKGYGAGQIAWIGDINRDKKDDYVVGVPYVLSPEIHIMVSKSDGSYTRKKTITSPQDPQLYPESFNEEGVKEIMMNSDFFGKSLLYVQNDSTRKLIVSAPSLEDGRAIVYDVKTWIGDEATKPSDVKMKDENGKKVYNGNGYEIYRIFDLDGDNLDDFVLTPSFKDQNGFDTNEVSALLHLYSSNDAKKIITINSKTRNYGGVSSFEMLDDLDQNGVQEIAIGFQHGLGDDEGKVKWHAGRVVILNGEEFLKRASEKGKKKTISLDDDTIVMERFFGNEMTLLMGAQIKRMWDINNDGIDEFVVSETGYNFDLPNSKDNQSQEIEERVGRVIVYDGSSMQKSDDVAFDIVGDRERSLFGSQIGVDRINHTMLISAPQYTEENFANVHQKYQGALYFYHWTKQLND